jgi:DNA uptake protein ComE-like DNA-binding protein
MHKRFDLALVLSSVAVAAGAGCVTDPDEPALGTAAAALESCGVGGDLLSHERLTPADIPSLSTLEAAQIVLAVQESAHTDVTTVEEAFDRVDEHEINMIVLYDAPVDQFYVEVEYGAGENSYGAIFYWDTTAKAAAIHDGFQEECGPVTYNYDEGDTAPECAGFLTYSNTASFAALDAFLPSNVAQAIVDARTAAPFTSVASVVAVDGVSEVRLQQILAAARTAGAVGASCSGIYDQIAISTAEEAAMVALLDEASAEEMHGILAWFINQTVVANLIANRPFGDASEIAATTGVGPATFRRFRNAATFRGPFEELVAEVNEIDHPDGQIRIDQHFDWESLLAPEYGLSGMTCFGIDPALLPPEATIRPTLGDGDEVVDEVTEAVNTANYLGELDVDPAPGLADLAARTDGHDFFGCYITYHPNPWVYDSTTFFVDTETGAGVLLTFHYVE